MTRVRAFEGSLAPIELECGVPLRHLPVRGWTAGPASDRLPSPPGTGGLVRRAADELDRIAPLTGALDPDVPTVLLVHALTGGAEAGGPGGWWAPLIGPEGPLDPRRRRILCFNNLGSCGGTHGPTDATFPRLREVPGPRAEAGLRGRPPVDEDRLPAPITSWDQARVLLLALDALGLQRVEAVIGGSLGGMIALCLAALAPDRVGRVVSIAADRRATPWVIGFNHVGRQAVLGDPARGLALARQLAHLSYRAGPGLEERHGRRTVLPHGGWAPTAPYRMQTYLEHQGGKLVRRFDPWAYVAGLDAMDHHDLERRPPRDAHERWDDRGPWGLGRLRMPVHAVGIDTDALFPAESVRRLAADLPDGTWHEIANPHGHDAFLLDWPALRRILPRALGDRR